MFNYFEFLFNFSINLPLKFKLFIIFNMEKREFDKVIAPIDFVGDHNFLLDSF